MPSSDTIHPVAIIGGGPVGLTSSILLSLRGIPHVLFERHSGTSIHPKACGINQRTMEIFREMGIEDEIYKVAAPPDIAGRTAWYTSLGPEGQEIFSRDAWGLGQYAAEYAKHSPSRYVILPQIRLEPIISRRAKELNPDGIHYSAEVTDIDEHDDHATLKVRFQANNAETSFKARYIIVSDGGRSFTDKLGVPWDGERDIFHMVTAHIRAPLRSFHPDPRNFLTWFTHPSMGGSTKTGFLYQVGPWPLAAHPPDHEEWVFACALLPTDPTRFDQTTLLTRLRTTLSLPPSLPVHLLSLSHWTVNALSARTYHPTPHTFLAGDAAHRIPPWGALGMNTGVQDAHNLVWKLAFGLHRPPLLPLLTSYDPERRPIGAAVAASSLHNLRSHALDMDAALGMAPTATPAANASAMAPYFDPAHPRHGAAREAVQAAQKALDSEFKAPGTEVGWFYASADFWGEGAASTHGGQVREDGGFETEWYFASTVAGHHVPHVWVEKEGKRVALRDLVTGGGLVLVVRRGEGWKGFGGELVRVVVVGEEEGGWRDGEGEWARVCGVSEGGAVLVRPDGIVGWRGEWDEGLLQRWREILDRVLYLGTPA